MTMELCCEAATWDRGGRRVLEACTLEVRAGELLAVAGPNGSGKSTLLAGLAGLLEPAAGRVTLDGAGLARLGQREIAQRVAYVPQEAGEGQAFTVREMVWMGRFARETGWPADAAAVADAMELADVSSLADRLYTRLSGGERQRVRLARALAGQASILLLDEPASALDLSHAGSLMELCGSLARSGRAVVMALHDLNAAMQHADRVALLHRGRMVCIGGALEVLTPERISAVFDVDAWWLPLGDAGVRVNRPWLAWRSRGSFGSGGAGGGGGGAGASAAASSGAYRCG